ncbi:unnamed protein product [Arabidopsis lyrata]|nr:unnamed protein product [Arabidopsis lyrata]
MWLPRSVLYENENLDDAASAINGYSFSLPLYIDSLDSIQIFRISGFLQSLSRH